MNTFATMNAEFVSLVSDLTRCVTEGFNSLVRAGELVIELNKDYTLKEISEAANILSVRDLESLIRIGNRQLIPELFVFKCPISKTLSKAPLELQEEIASNGLRLVTKGVKGYIAKTIPLAQIKRHDYKTAFDNDGKLRSISAQKTYLKNLPEVTKRVNYSVQNGSLLVYKAMKFSKKQLTEILAEM